LHKYLQAAISGGVDYADMNDETKAVLFSTYKKLMDQVESEKDAFKELGAYLSANPREERDRSKVTNLENIFADKLLNPFGFPLEYLQSSSKSNTDENNLLLK
jgi:hypothetical protein